MYSKTIRYTATFAVILSLFVVMLGAYTRLTNAGLGCPDWPGCYGRMALPLDSTARMSAQARFPTIAIDPRKAWTEMAHRYVAGTLVLLVISINAYILRQRLIGDKIPWVMPASLLMLIFFQAALGMWTVTLKLLPLVVMGHLLGGISIFACLSYFRAQLSNSKHIAANKWRFWIGLGIVVVFLQIALGGWVSANYAGISCLGFPQCNGSWLPDLELIKGYNLLMPIGANYQGGVLDTSVRITIQYVHRLGALVVTAYVLILMGTLLLKSSQIHLRYCSLLIIGLLSAQIILGIVNVTYLLPLWAAVAHNGVAAMILAAFVVMYYFSKGDIADAS